MAQLTIQSLQPSHPQQFPSRIRVNPPTYNRFMDLSTLWRQANEKTPPKTRLPPPHSRPEQLLTLYLLRQQLAQELLPRALPAAALYLPGSTAHSDLTRRWLRLALRTQTPLTAQLGFWEETMASWQVQCGELSKKGAINLLQDTLPRGQLLTKFGCVENYLAYLDSISADLAGVLTGKFAAALSEMNETDCPPTKLTTHALLFFLETALPKTLFPLILPRPHLPPALHAHKQLECVFSNQQLEAAVRLNTDYAQLMRWLLEVAISRGEELTAPQQKILMLLLFRYFYLFHGERSSRAVEMLVQGYNLVDEGVRYALTEDFALFLRTARKVGKAKMVDWLLSKSPWMAQISQKLCERSFIGYKPENAAPLSSFNEAIEVPRRGKVQRYVEVLYPSSLLFLNIELEQMDVEVRVRRLDDLLEELEQPEVVWEGKVTGRKEEVLQLPNCGIYEIEFDNSASWINAKQISYQRALLAPLDLLPENHHPWISNYHQQPLTTVHPSLIRKYQNDVVLGSIEISQTQQTFQLKLCAKTQAISYVYETDSLERLLGRARKIKEELRQYQWKIDSQLLSDVPALQQLSNLPLPLPQRKKEKDLLIEIPLRY